MSWMSNFPELGKTSVAALTDSSVLHSQSIIPYFPHWTSKTCPCGSQRTIARIGVEAIMAENVPPSTGASGAGTRGVPYYEKLKRDLRDTIQKKRLLDKNMV